MEEPTTRELEILQAYVDFGRITDTADELGLAVSTVKNMLSSLRHKLECRSTVQAVYVLMRDKGRIV